MTPREIAKIRLAAQSRSSRELAEKLVNKYITRLTILRAKPTLTREEYREREDLQDLVISLA